MPTVTERAGLVHSPCHQCGKSNIGFQLLLARFECAACKQEFCWDCLKEHVKACGYGQITPGVPPMRKLSQCRFQKAKLMFTYCSNCREFFVYDLWPIVTTKCPNADCYYPLVGYACKSFQDMLDFEKVTAVRVSPDGRCFADDTESKKP